MNKKPIAILRVFYKSIGEREFVIHSRCRVDLLVEAQRVHKTSFCIEWLDQTNGRTTTTTTNDGA